jgi:DNA repair protein RecN (Recombination protein N)
MLQKLYIQNYAIIDELTVAFNANFNIITGETGAGKSILVGALGLVLGNRADSNVLRDATKKCIVEASFQSKISKEIKQFFLQEELDADETITIRREIAANGKSRSFINDTPVNLTQLKVLASMLVDLHQQFDTLELGDDDFQRNVVDAIASHSDVIAQYQHSYNQYSSTQKLLQQLKNSQAEANKELDYNKYLHQELEDANLKPNELEELDQELILLNNAEHIKTVLETSSNALNLADEPIVPLLKTMHQQLKSLTHLHPAVEPVAQRLLSTQIELADIANELETINDRIQLNPQRLLIVNDRIATGYKLLKKHQVTTTEQLLQLQNELSNKLLAFSNIDDSILQKEKELNELKIATQLLGETITNNRKKVAPQIEIKTGQLLKQVGMPNAAIKIKITDTDLQPYGTSNIEFLFDANNSGKLEPLRKVASGGELSRLMLSIKSIVAKSMQLPTLIFDEIDTGISGEAARQVGAIMKNLATHHQLISITHQPQIAAMASAHYFVYKKDKNGSIQTGIKELTISERERALANMMAGDNPSETVMQNAKEMLANS